MRFVNNPFTDKLDVGSLTGSGAPPVETVSGNDGIAVGPNGTTFDLDLLGNNTQGINVTGDAGTNTLTIAGIDATQTQKGVVETATNAEAAAQSSTAVALTPSNIPSLFSSTPLPASQGGTGVASPAANSLLISNGSSAFTVLGTAGNGQIPIGSIGSAPVLANIASADASVTITNGPGTIDLSVAGGGGGAVDTLTGNTGGAISPTLGNINTVGSGSITTAGSGDTLTTQLTGLTTHSVLVGAGTATITKVAPSATSGVPLISQGAAADPTFGTAVVAGGGTGATSFTAHGIVLGQGTGALTALGEATNGQLAIGSNGADPVLANITSTGGSITVTNGAGTIDLSTTVTTPTGALGTVLQGQGVGSDPAYSTATYPSVATGTGTILRADGTNWSATTATYPATTTVSQLLYSSAGNVVGGLTTANNGTLVTSATGVPSILAGPGTTGNILQSNAAAAPSYSTATYPSTAGTSGNVLTSDGTNWSSVAPAASGITSVVTQSFTASGTYTPTTGMKYCIAEVVGGGGGGGGIPASGAGTVTAAGGGGGGGYARKTFSAATIGASQAITIGAGGAGGAAGVNGGVTGGTSSIGALLSATGGGGGNSMGAAGTSFITNPGGAGSGASGDFNAFGMSGGYGLIISSLNGMGGAGGSSFFCGGANAMIMSTGAGNAGTSWGGGGGGALSANSTARAGGNGVGGIIIITEFI